MLYNQANDVTDCDQEKSNLFIIKTSGMSINYFTVQTEH